MLVSHLHFDHLSLGSLDLIERKIARLYLPEGGTVYVPKSAVPTIELPRWQQHEQDGLRVTAVPVRHVGFRYSGDRAWMTDSFTGYVIEYHGLVVYFGGDTAYTERFETRARASGASISPSCRSRPSTRAHSCAARTPIRARHSSAFDDLGARYMLAVHYDTFVNSLDELGEAPRVLRGLLAEHGLDEARVAILAHGEQRVFVPR